MALSFLPSTVHLLTLTCDDMQYELCVRAFKVRTDGPVRFIMMTSACIRERMFSSAVLWLVCTLLQSVACLHLTAVCGLSVLLVSTKCTTKPLAGAAG